MPMILISMATVLLVLAVRHKYRKQQAAELAKKSPPPCQVAMGTTREIETEEDRQACEPLVAQEPDAVV